MISTDYVQVLARYNAWQNQEVITACQTLDEAALRADRGAFFGSIFGTLNHILWADRAWMSRFHDWNPPEVGFANSTELCLTFDAWKADRLQADMRIKRWAEDLRPSMLRGDLRWHSGATGTDMVRPMGLCVTHFFNHQTHHRGQIHAMLTAAGAKTADTDLIFMTETP